MAIEALTTEPTGQYRAPVQFANAAAGYTRSRLEAATRTAAADTDLTRTRLKALEGMIRRQQQGELITGLVQLVGAAAGGILGAGTKVGSLGGAMTGAEIGGIVGAVATGTTPGQDLPNALAVGKGFSDQKRYANTVNGTPLADAMGEAMTTRQNVSDLNPGAPVGSMPTSPLRTVLGGTEDDAWLAAYRRMYGTRGKGGMY